MRWRVATASRGKGWWLVVSAAVGLTASACGSGRPPPECSTDADCDDGLACNGAERCEHGFCSPEYPRGAPTDHLCDDGVPCTAGECTPLGCEQIPLDSRCDDDVSCTVDRCTMRGCENRPDDAMCPDGVCTTTGCAPECTVEPCDPVVGCGCGEDKCELSSSLEPVCEGWTAEPRGAHQPCTEDVGQCDRGLVCVEVGDPPDESATICLAVCRADADCERYPGFPERGRCFSFGGSGYGYCSSGCDPFDLYGSSACPAGTDCRPVTPPGGSTAAGQCLAPEGNAEHFDSCSATTDCEEGLLCLEFSDGTACVPACGDDDDCPSSWPECGATTLDGVGYCR